MEITNFATNLVVGGGLFGALVLLVKTLLDHKRGSATDAVAGFSSLYALMRAENKELRDKVASLEKHISDRDAMIAELQRKVAALEGK